MIFCFTKFIPRLHLSELNIKTKIVFLNHFEFSLILQQQQNQISASQEMIQFLLSLSPPSVSCFRLRAHAIASFGT